MFIGLFCLSSILKSTLKSDCKHCGKDIEIGSEIIRIGNGKWIHETCATNIENYMKKGDEPIPEESEKFEYESKVNLEKSLKCANCQCDSFLESKSETIILDEGAALTKKLFICHKCSYIMQFVEKIIS